MRLVEHADSEQDATLFLTAAFTGPRASELRALRWRSVDCNGWSPLRASASPRKRRAVIRVSQLG